MSNAIQDAVHAHTNLNTLGLIASMLEAGALYGEENKTTEKIIALCNKEISRQLKIYESCVSQYKAHQAKGQ
jgi:hypothetical protein